VHSNKIRIYARWTCLANPARKRNAWSPKFSHPLVLLRPIWSRWPSLPCGPLRCCCLAVILAPREYIFVRHSLHYFFRFSTSFFDWNHINWHSSFLLIQLWKNIISLLYVEFVIIVKTWITDRNLSAILTKKTYLNSYNQYAGSIRNFY